MKNCNMTLTKQQQRHLYYHLVRHKHDDYLTGGKILPTKQHRIIVDAKFLYSPLSKAFEEHVNTIKDQGNKQVEAIQSLDLSTKTEESEKLEYIFLQNQLNKLINSIYMRKYKFLLH